MKTYAAIILLTNNLMVWENGHAITLSGKKQKLHIYYSISNTLKSVHISEVRFKSPEYPEFNITDTNKKSMKYKSYFILPNMEEVTIFGTGVQKKHVFLHMHFAYFVHSVLLRFCRTNEFCPKIQHYFNHFFLLQSVHTMLYKSQKLSSKYDFWQYQLMLLKYIQTYMVILKSQGSMYVSVYPSANKLESISQ